MFRAIFLWVLSPVWEVRIVSTTTGKDIPGRCVYKGGYLKARKQFKKAKGKYGDMIRLQAVVRTDWKMNETRQVEAPEGMVHVQVAPGITEGRPVYDIGASNARQSEFMHEHQDEPNVDGPEVDDIPLTVDQMDEHYCNRLGPMDYDKQSGNYYPTCSVCGGFSSENV